MRLFPTTENASKLSHPTAGPMKHIGAEWPGDGFTYRLVTDGIMTTDPSKGWHPSEEQHSSDVLVPPEATEGAGHTSGHEGAQG